MERKINHPKRFLWLTALLVVVLFGACHFEKNTLNGDGTAQVLQQEGDLCYQGTVLRGRSHGYGGREWARRTTAKDGKLQDVGMPTRW